MNLTTLIGTIAAILTTSSFLPQVIKTWKTKSAKDISLKMYIILCTGVLLWFVYGLLLSDLPIIIANAVAFLFTLSVIFLKIKYKE